MALAGNWLAHDRVGKDEFPLTQEFVAIMLGTSRPTVTVVAGTLQKAVRTSKPPRCECYQTATDLLKAVTRRS